MSISVVRQTYDERVKMYLKRSTKDKLISMLQSQDEYYGKDGKVEPLSKAEYKKMTKQQLAEMLSSRSVVLFPDSCTECENHEDNKPEVVYSGPVHHQNCLFDKEELELINIGLKSILRNPEVMDIARAIIVDNALNADELKKERLTNEEVHAEISRIRGSVKTYLKHLMYNVQTTNE